MTKKSKITQVGFLLNRFLKYVQLANLCWLLKRAFMEGLIYIMWKYLSLNISLFRDRRRSSVVSLSGTANHWQRHSEIRNKLFDNFSGEDHGVNTIGNISRSVSSRNVASGWEKIRMVTGKSYISESRR